MDFFLSRFNYRTFYKVANGAMKDDGILLLHTMGIQASDMPVNNKFVSKYIFPNSEIPKLENLIMRAQDLFVLEDLHNFGADYELTLLEWENNLVNGWDKLKDKYSEDLRTLWLAYLHGAQGLLGGRHIHLFQFVFSKNGILGGYQAPR